MFWLLNVLRSSTQQKIFLVQASTCLTFTRYFREMVTMDLKLHLFRKTLKANIGFTLQSGFLTVSKLTLRGIADGILATILWTICNTLVSHSNFHFFFKVDIKSIYTKVQVKDKYPVLGFKRWKNHCNFFF